MLGKTNVRGTRERDPHRLTKSPMKGNMAAMKVLNVKKASRKISRRLTLLQELMSSSSFNPLVSRNSCMGAANIYNRSLCIKFLHLHLIVVTKLDLWSSKHTCWETTDCRNAVELMPTLAHLGPLSSLGRYSDTEEPNAQYPTMVTP